MHEDLDDPEVDALDELDLDLATEQIKELYGESFLEPAPLAPDEPNPHIGALIVRHYVRSWSGTEIPSNGPSIEVNRAISDRVNSACVRLGFPEIARLPDSGTILDLLGGKPSDQVQFDFSRLAASQSSRIEGLLKLLETIYGYQYPARGQQWKNFAGQIHEDLIASATHTHPTMWVDGTARPVGEKPPWNHIDSLRDLEVSDSGFMGGIVTLFVQSKYVSTWPTFISCERVSRYLELLRRHRIPDHAFYLVVGRGGLPFAPAEQYVISFEGVRAETFACDFASHAHNRRRRPADWLKIGFVMDENRYVLS